MPSALNMRLRSSARAGLPLDESSAASLKASRAQYQTAAKELAEYPFDALFFSGFTNAYDAQCALMGARAVYDGPVFLSYALTDAGELPTHTHTLAEAVALADEYGADVIASLREPRMSILLLRSRSCAKTPQGRCLQNWWCVN